MKKQIKDLAGKFPTETGAGVGLVAGGLAGAVKGGSIGVALFGTAIGMPLIIPAAGIGIIGGTAIGFGIKVYKNKKTKK